MDEALDLGAGGDRRDDLVVSASLAPSPTSRLFVSMPSMIATTISSVPIMSVPIASNSGLPVMAVRPTPNEREHEADERGDVFEQHDRQLGRLRVAHERRPTTALARARGCSP